MQRHKDRHTDTYRDIHTDRQGQTETETYIQIWAEADRYIQRPT